MKMIAARCSGMLALALLGLAVSVKADSIYVDALPNGYGISGRDFELPAAEPQPQYSRDRDKAIRCCALRIWSGPSFLEDFSWAPDGLNAQSGHRGLVVSTSAPVSLAKSASGLSAWDRTEAIDGDALSNEFGSVSANFALTADSGALNGGYGSFASPWAGLPGDGAFFEDPSGGAEPQSNNVDGNGKTITDPVGVKRGDGGPPVTRNAPLSVSEPSMLALLVAGLAAVGLLMLKRTA